MASKNILGTLLDSNNVAIANATLRFISTSTRSVINSIITEYRTDSLGAYNFEVLHGIYTIQVKRSDEVQFRTVCANAYVYDTNPETLEALIRAQSHIKELDEDLIQEMLGILAQANAAAEAAADSAATATTKAAAASTSAANAATSAATATTKATDASTSAANAATSATTATTKAAAASTSAANAATSATTATTKATEASTSAANAATSATTATTKATEASTSAANAATSAATATTKAAAASTSATSAAASAATATTKATDASTSAAAAADSATTATTKAAAASTSAANAATSATTATTKATDASTSAAAAADSAATATTKATEASTSAANAATSAATATTKATEASTSAANSATSATTATTKAAAASTSAANAATSATTATTKATEASTSAANAAASAATATTKATEASTSAANAAASAATATTKATEAAASATEAAQSAALSAGALIEAGSVNLSSGVYPTPIKDAQGNNRSCFWKVTVGGTVGSEVYGIGDSLVYSKEIAGYYKIDNTESVTSVNGKQGVVVLAKADVGLGNVDNTSDLSKPISTATQSALDAKVPTSRTVNGKALTSNISITATDLGLGNVNNTSDLSKPISTATQTALDAKVPTSRTVNGKALSADISITASDLGLGSVDNTSDLSKPISTATQTALDAKVPTSRTVNGKALTSNISITADDVGALSSSGTAAAAIKLATARTLTIGKTGKAFDGTGDASWSLGELGVLAGVGAHGTNWYKLATVVIGQPGAARMTVYGGSGYNVGSWSQANKMEVIIRGGNGSPKGLTVRCYSHDASVKPFTEICWVNTTGDTYDIYVKGTTYAQGLLAEGYSNSGQVIQWYWSDTGSATMPTGATAGQMVQMYNTASKPTSDDVGLGNVNNTSDLNKPISTATQTALDAKVPTSRTVNGKALTGDISITASDVGAASGGYAFTLPTGDINTALRNNSGFFNYSNATNRPSWPVSGAHTWDYYFNAAHSNTAGYNGVIAMDFNGRGIAFKAISNGADMGWKYVYHTGYKPTADDVGALPTTGGTITGDTNIKKLISSHPGQSAINPTDYGFYAYANGTQTIYGMNLLNAKDQFGSSTDIWGTNIFAPNSNKYIFFSRKVAANGNNADYTLAGNIALDSGNLTMSGEMYANGTNRVYHQGNKPTAADVGALPATGGSITGDIQVSGTISEKGQRVYSPNNPPPPTFGRGVREAYIYSGSTGVNNGLSPNFADFSTLVYSVGNSVTVNKQNGYIDVTIPWSGNYMIKLSGGLSSFDYEIQFGLEFRAGVSPNTSMQDIVSRTVLRRATSWEACSDYEFELPVVGGQTYRLTLVPRGANVVFRSLGVTVFNIGGPIQ